MKTFDTRSLPYRSMKNHWRILQKDSRKLSLNRFFSRTFGQTVTPREVVQKTLNFSEELKFYYELYQILLFHFQEMNSKYFFELLEDNLDLVNPAFKTVFKTFLKYKTYITNAMELPYSTLSWKQPINSSKTSRGKRSALETLRTLKQRYILL